MAHKKTQKNSKALIIFTREPEAGSTKTRLTPYFSPEQCAELHRCMLSDLAEEVRSVDADIVVSHTGPEPVFLRKVFGDRRCAFIPQHGDGIGARMENAFAETLDAGYDRVILIGTDIPELEAESINAAFALLSVNDTVIGPTEDGGYYLIGMKALRHEAFAVRKYSTITVFEETVQSMQVAGLKVGKADTYPDIDIPGDIAGFRHRMREDAGLRHSRTGRFLARNESISVIIPVYNESREIGGMLDRLEPYADECEIIFVDGGSTDDTVPLIQSRGGVKLICSEKGRGIQMNKGALESSGDIVFFLHCDSILPDDFIGEIRRVMAKHEWGCFGVKFPSRNFFMLTNRIISNHRALMRRLPFGDQGIFIDRTLFFETGMFPEAALMEDYEYSLRMRRYGLRPGMTRRRIVTSARRYGKGTMEILRTEMLMWRLRHMYRKGVSTDEIKALYDDIR